MPKFYLTTAIDYSNGEPHLGHALEKIGADAIARYHRLRGDDVHFLIGMDEHGQKVAQTAAEQDLTPQALADRVAESFQSAWARLGISNDKFIRTTSESHRAGVRAFIERWPAQLHVIGKDITRFHCVIWPAMLESAGLPLPERVWAHGFMSLDGQRFSKSAGVWLELGDAADRFGVDALRYFLLREVP